MKRGYIALGLFLVITVCVFLNAYFLRQTLKRLENEVEALLYVSPSPRFGVEEAEELQRHWQEKEKYLMLFVNRNETAAISVLIGQTVAAAKQDMVGDFQVSVAGVLEAIRQLDNITCLKLHYLF